MPGRLFAEQVVAVRRRAVCGRDVLKCAHAIETLQRSTDAVNLVGAVVVPKRLSGRGRDKVRVTAQVMFGVDVVPTETGVVVAEPVAPVVAATSILGLAGLGLELERVGAETKVAATNVHRQAGAGGGDGPAAVAVGTVHPIVESILESVHSVLLVSLVKAGEEHAGFVGFAVAVCVACEKDVWGGADEDTVAPRHDSIGERKAIEKNGRVVVAAVVIAILQPANTPSVLPFAVEA